MKLVDENNKTYQCPNNTNNDQEAQLMLTTGAMRLAVSRGQQTWYHFGSVATFR